MSIKKMIYGMLALLIVVSFVSSASTFAVLNQNKDNGKIVNYTGVVRGASQRAVKLYLLETPNEKLLTRITTLMDGLLNGDGALGLPKPSNQEYIADMEKVRDYWQSNVLPQFSVPIEKMDNKLILSSSEEFFALADAAVSSADAFTAQGIIWLKLMSVVTFVINLLCMILVGLIIKRKVLAPMIVIEDTMNRLAKGELQTHMEYESKNELGHMADSIRMSFRTLYKYIKDIDRAMGEMSKGNFDIAPEEPFIGDFKGIEDSITRFIIDISDTFNHLGKSSAQVQSGADQVCLAAQTLAEGTIEQASAVEILMQSVSTITKQVQENAEGAERASTMAENTSEAVLQSNEKMQALEQAMIKINMKSGEISKIIKTIEDIAFQTNILALNAAVEAARAGAAGKGFAVVADEVRNLASKSAEAAKNTNQLIADSVQSIREGVSMANDTAQALVSIVDSTVATKNEITEISKASREQSEALNKVSLGVERIRSVIHTNSATSEESAAESEELSGQATLMKEFISKFNVKDENVVAKMKKIFSE